MTRDTGFYDREVGSRLRDMWWGNDRMDQALAWLLPALEDRRRVLEIGCGVGWASAEMALADPHRRVVACDLSSRQIQVADRLFPDPRVQRIAGRFPQVPDVVPEGGFDAVVMLDVYEHIPAAARESFDQALNQVLAADGVVLLTCPTPRHQEWLRRTDPAGLQPVDEDITPEVLEALADRLNARVAEYRLRSIWSEEDYLHARIERRSAPSNEALPTRPRLGIEERRALIRERLAVQPGRDGILFPRPPGRPALLVAAYRRSATSETFIRDQIEGLPFRTSLLHGWPLPTRFEDDRSVLPAWMRGIQRVLGLVWGRKRAEEGVLRRLPDLLIDRWYARGFRAAGVDAVLAQYGPMGAILNGAARRAGIPMIVHFHGYDAHQRSEVQAHVEGYRRMWKDGAHSVVVSEPMRDALEALGAPRDRIHLIPCGTRIDMLPRAHPRSAGETIVAVGRLVEKKDPLSTVRAFAIARGSRPGARLTLIGDGPLRDAVWAEVVHRGLQDAVELTGSLSHAEVLDHMRASRVFVQHSRVASNGDQEGSPVAVIEAAGCGLPVVATRHAGIPAAVLEGESGVLVDEGDVEGMAAAMIALLADPELAHRLGATGREHVRAHFDQQDQLRKLAAVIEHALDASS